MSIFIQKLNPMTGLNDWVVQQEDYDYHQEVARSSFADMLHDTERNQKYELALKSAIEKLHKMGKKANVLDIGTGTGLLSMMAVRQGADTVTACEAFKPMSECALKIIARNGFGNKIKIISKRSTDLVVGPSGDLPQKCNVLVTEVFDTELIGEGALATFSHAHQNLLEKECFVVPQSATIYAQVVECPLARNWNKFKDVYDSEGKILLKIPQKIKDCQGSSAVHDLQLSQLKFPMKNIVPPLPVFRFDWSGNTPFIFEQSTINTCKVENTGVAQMVFMWWDLEMDSDGQIKLSCAPWWAHPDQKQEIPWRDHWMQAIYYLPHELNVKKDQEITLISCHDEFSLWFSVKNDLKVTEQDYLKPVCDCGVHVTLSRTRIGQINNTTRNKTLLKLLEKHVSKDSVLLVLSDGCYLSLSAGNLGAKKIYFVETNYLSRNILWDFVQYNDLQSKVEIFENLEGFLSSGVSDVNLVFGEPYFLNSILPWDNMLFVYLLKGVRKVLSDDAVIFPKVSKIVALAVRFKDLNKIRLPLDKCEGLDMKDFDDLIEVR